MRGETVVVPIYGFICAPGDSRVVERALARHRGILRAYVNPALEMAYVEYDPQAVKASELVTVVERAGYRAGVPRRL